MNSSVSVMWAETDPKIISLFWERKIRFRAQLFATLTEMRVDAT